LTPFTKKAVLGLTAMSALCLCATGCGSSASGTGTTSSTGPSSRTSPAASQPDPLAGLNANQIAAKAIRDLKSAPSFTISGTTVDDGEMATVSVGVTGKGCVMTLTMGSKGKATFVYLGQTVWMKADDAFWKSQAGGDAGSSTDTAMYAGKYVRIPAPADSGPAVSGGACNSSEMTSSSSVFPLLTDAVKGALTTVSGQRVYPLTDKAKDESMYVTDAGAPRIIKIVSTKPGNDFQLNVTDGIPESITAPPASETATMP
jgi:hypothetical protein